MDTVVSTCGLISAEWRVITTSPCLFMEPSLSLTVFTPRTCCCPKPLAVHQDSWGLAVRAAPQEVVPGCIGSSEIPSQGQDFLYVFIEFHEFPASQFVPPVHISQDGSSALEQIDWSLQFGVNCRLNESANNVIIRKRSTGFVRKGRYIYLVKF